MWIDITDLREFYTTPQGQLARRLVLRHVASVWPNLDGLSLAGLGYATPYMGPFRQHAERTLALMPARQGVVNWPSRGPSAATLVDEEDLPLCDAAVDRLILAHCLEHSDDPLEVLREAARVLAPAGRLIMIVPNRRGMWARVDTSPFGHGRPYSRGQLTRLMRAAGFSPTDWRETLFGPPIARFGLLRLSDALESSGRWLPLVSGGVQIVEAVKQFGVARPVRAMERVRQRIPQLAPAPRPVPAGRIGKA